MATNNNNIRNAFQTLVDREESLNHNRQIWGRAHMHVETGGEGAETGLGGYGEGMSSEYDTFFTSGNSQWNTTNINYNTLSTAITQTMTIPAHLIYGGTRGGSGGSGTSWRYGMSSRMETPEKKLERETQEAYRVLKNKKLAVQKLFLKWKQENQALKQNEINTEYGSYRYQPWSIEARLLKAIGSGQGFKTKTTEYSPSTNKVYLHGHEIAVLSATTKEIVSVSFPDVFTTKKEINLFRLRLRQLGQKCKANRGRTELQLALKEKQILVPGLNFRIPIQHRVIVIPGAYVSLIKAPMIRDSVQLSLNLPNPEQRSNLFCVEEKLKTVVEEYRDYRLEFTQTYTPDEDLYTFRVTAWPINIDHFQTGPREQFSVQRTVGSYEICMASGLDFIVRLEGKMVRLVREELDRRHGPNPDTLAAIRNRARRWTLNGDFND